MGGNTIEIFSTATQVACDKCGFVAYNDALSCEQWCQYARKCVGDEMYERRMEIARRQKAERSTKEEREMTVAEQKAALRKKLRAAMGYDPIHTRIGEGFLLGGPEE